ncbi:MAG: feruloyl-CoA synthase [Myxococcota bacterium]
MHPLRLLSPAVDATPTPDGGLLLASRTPLPAPAPTIGTWLDRWAAERPDRPFLAERTAAGPWRTISYAEAAHHVAALGTPLRDRGAGPGRPVAILSDNGVDHALVALAALHVGAPVVPVSPAYALLSQSFRRLRHIVDLVRPAVVFAADRERYAPALRAIGADPLDADDVRRAASGPPAPRADIGPDTIAKILFTSGSTGEPKGVVNTHRMLTANQESLTATWPFLDDEPPVVVDWLPWSHTFGGNHNFHLVLRNGGTLYVDAGRPAPGLLQTTLDNLADVGPTIWFNVPRGFDQATDALEADPALAARVFRNLRVLFYAAAALAPTTRARLEVVAREAGHPDLFFTSAWGSTETSPLATSAHFPTPTTGVLGVPVPGVQLKLAPVGDELELRVKGPNVTPGTWQADGTVAPVALDADGFLPTGDAGVLVDPADPAAGVRFAGRISENFKLSSGTWVSVGAVRLALVDACAPLLADAVIAGHDREALGALLLVAPAARAAHDDDALREALFSALSRYDADHPGSSERIARALVLTEPLSLDEGETTDKGYTNQRRVLARRAAQVERLFAAAPDPDVLVL